MSGTSIVLDLEFQPHMQVDFAGLVERQYDVLGGPTLEDLLAEEDDSGGDDEDSDDDDGDEPNVSSDKNEALDENKDQTGKEEGKESSGKETSKAAPAKDSSSNTTRKKRVAVGRYDLNDPFLDQDEEIPWESNSQPIQEGFFVFRGTIGPKEGASTEKTTKTGKRKAADTKNGAPKKRKSNNDGDKKPSTPRKKKKAATPTPAGSESVNGEDEIVSATEQQSDGQPAVNPGDENASASTGEAVKPAKNTRPVKNDTEKPKRGRQKKAEKSTSPSATNAETSQANSTGDNESAKADQENKDSQGEEKQPSENATNSPPVVPPAAPPAPQRKAPSLEEILASRPN